MLRTTLLTVGLLALAASLGCDSTIHSSSVITEYDQGDANAEMEFWHGLSDQLVTTNNDAMHGLIELANETDPSTSYEQRLAWLKQRELLDADFNGAPDEAVKRGTVAQVICRILKIEGGVSMRLIGADPRYATRELVYLEIMEYGTEQQALSGIEFVGTISRAQDFDGRVP